MYSPGRIHSDHYHLWQEDEVASQAIKEMAELGTTDSLDHETQGRGGILDVFSTPKIDIGQGMKNVKVFADTFHSKVSSIAHLSDHLQSRPINMFMSGM